MQTAIQTPSTARAIGTAPSQQDTAGKPAAHTLANYQIIRRNGAVVPFEPNKIAIAMMKAFLAVHGTQGAASASVRETVDGLTQAVVRAMMRSRPGGGTFHIEDVQDQVELGLMRGGHHEVARAYVLYRERRSQERTRHGEQEPRRPRQAACAGPRRARRARPDRTKALIDRPAKVWATASAANRSWPRPCATCTTACRWTRSTRHRSWPPAR